MKKKILVIDDDLIYCEILRKILCLSYELVFTDNTHEALDLISLNNSFDLVIADINIPGVEGFGFIKLLLSKMNLMETPLIVISGMDDKYMVNRLLVIGVLKYFIKPLEHRVFKQEIDSLVKNTKRVL